MQNIFSKIQTYSILIKLGLQGKRTFKSSLWVTDFTASSPNFIHSETLIPRMSILVYQTIHLDHKYLFNCKD